MENADRANANEAVEADEVGVAERGQHRVPTPEEVELEYTFPQDFQGRSWQDVVTIGQYFRLIIDLSCIEIPYEKFLHCKYLIEIVYPEGTESKQFRIGHWAFGYCCNLQRMNRFPDGLVKLGESAFVRCSKLQGRITIPPSIRCVRSSCFSNCKSITSVAFESSTATQAETDEVIENT